MSNKTIFMLMAALLAASIYFIACGQTNPATAPISAVVEFVGSEGGTGSLTITIGPDNEHGIPSSCFDEYRNLLVTVCEEAGVSEAQCEGGEWNNYEDMKIPGTNTTYGQEIKTRLASTEGSCGYDEVILSAIVYRTSGSNGGATAEKLPMNGVELRWIGSPGVELFLVDDPPDVDPLSNPYVAETDDRGLCEIKVRIPLPTQAGITNDYLINADIGVDLATYNITVTSVDVTDSADDATDDTSI